MILGLLRRTGRGLRGRGSEILRLGRFLAGFVDIEHGLVDIEHGLVDIEHGLVDIEHGLVDLDSPTRY